MTLARDLHAAAGRSSPSRRAAVAVLFQQAPPYSMNVWLGVNEHSWAILDRYMTSDGALRDDGIGNPGELLRREMNCLRMERGATLTAARAEGKRIDRELDTLLDLILNGGHTERINAKIADSIRQKTKAAPFSGTAYAAELAKQVKLVWGPATT